MAMLAEPRQKKRRYNLTPRGKALYEDESRFGTKMLEKMGWSKGKGLGANLHGSKDFVRVRMRNTHEGLGFEDRDDHWTQHEQDFSGLLNTLNGDKTETNGADEENGSDIDEAPKVGFGFATVPKTTKVVKLKDKISGVSLEEKSKMSKARVHYRKFTKGKDIAQYSEKDLANIFGKKVVETEQANGVYEALTAITFSQAEEIDDGEEQKEVKPNFAGVQTVSTGLSLNDYFKQKMEAMKNKRKSLNNLSVEGVNEEMCENDTNGETKKKSKKRKRQEAIEENGNEAIEDIIESEVQESTDYATQAEALPGETASESKIEKKNKKRKALESMELKEVENVDETKTKKKKSKKGKDKDVISPPEVQENLVQEVDRKKPKKSKRNKDDLPLEGIEATAQDENLKEEKKKKIKQRNKGGDENINTSHAGAALQVDEMLMDQQPVKAKKSKRSKEVVLPETPEEPPDYEISTDQTLKTKMKKDKKVYTTDEAITLPQTALDVCIDEVVVQKKKKSKKTKKLETTIDPKTEVSEDTKTIQTMTLDELIAKYNSYNVYTISSFCAEKFRNVDIEKFEGATLSHLPGYGYSYDSTDLQMKIECFPQDEQRILQLWNCTINKYQLANPKAIFNKYRQNMVIAYHAKQKSLPRLHMKAFKRKSIFQSI